MKETELYLPVKNLLQGLGYSVTSEVNGVDVVAIKDNEITIVELKTSFNLKLILQAVKRQKITTDVYIGIPKPKYKRPFGKDFNDKKLLLRRLGLGLIFVSLNTKTPYAQIVFEPKPFDMNKSLSQNKAKKASILEEINHRHGDNNLAGTNGKLVTSYREKALLIASYLEENGAMSPKDLKTLGTDKDTTRILYQNHYQWFERVSRGVYGLSEIGIKEIDDYRHIVEKLR